MKKQTKGFTPIKSGFTLIELLVATVVISILSIVTTNLLFSSMLAKSKQQSIEVSTDTIRIFLSEITKLIQESQTINLPNTSSIEIKSEVGCTGFRYNTGTLSIEKAYDSNTPCNATLYLTIIDNGIKISNLQFSKYPPVSNLPNSVTISVGGVIEDHFGEHPFEYSTTVFPRLNY